MLPISEVLHFYFTFFLFFSIALCTNEQPNFLNYDHCKISYDENVCVKENCELISNDDDSIHSNYKYLMFIVYDFTLVCFAVDSTNTLVDVQLVVTFDDETLANFHK